MNYRYMWVALVSCPAVLSLRADPGFIVHEWGTFTAVHASDGRLLSGLEREEHRLPNFVRSHMGFAPADKGWSRPVKNVTIKMETPVLYFYSDTERAVKVDVGFTGGSISQWYPERSGGERLPISMSTKALQALPPIDFATGYAGSVAWDATVLARGSAEAITAREDWETPQWPRARVAEANRVRTPDGAVEGFLFYRGIGNFDLPLRLTAAASGALTVMNMGKDPIPYLLVYQNDVQGGPKSRELRDLAPGEHRVVTALTGDLMRMGESLMAEGLTADESKAMLATWRESYFEAPGLRVFWIVPRAFTDRILPITISPTPDKLERVLVGRSEVLTPAFEAELVNGFHADGGTRWTDDRYFLAYRERTRQLGVVLNANTP